MEGTALIDRRRRSVVTLREHRLGKKPANAGKEYKAVALRPPEVEGLLAATSRRGPIGARNRALIVTMWRCALRCAETLDLLPHDLDLGSGRLVVMDGKGSKTRVLGVDPYTVAFLQPWLDYRRELGIASTAPVFCVVHHPTRGKRMWDSTVRELLKDLGAKAGVERRVHPHGLRHTRAAEWRREGVDLYTIMRMLGHNDLRTTERYIGHLEPTEVIDAMREAPWHLSPSLLPGAGRAVPSLRDAPAEQAAAARPRFRRASTAPGGSDGRQGPLASLLEPSRG